MTFVGSGSSSSSSSSCRIFTGDIRIRVRMVTGDMSKDIHSPGPVIWEFSP